MDKHLVVSGKPGSTFVIQVDGERVCELEVDKRVTLDWRAPPNVTILRGELVGKEPAA